MERGKPGEEVSETTAASPSGPERKQFLAAERAYRTCPACGAEMTDRSCKLRCPREGCGFYLSCSDFY